MLIEWMAYATLITALMGCAALAAERVAAIWRGGQRFVWLAAMVAAVVVPVMLSVRRVPVTPVPVATQTIAPRFAEVPAITIAKSSLTREPLFAERARQALATIDPFLRDAWLAGSLAMLALFGRATIGLRRLRARWPVIDLAGERLLLAPDAGPAVVGVFHPQVVVPQWALSLDPTARELMLRHEAEHIRARDPHLLVVAAFALVLFPWNAGLWFVVRRLRLAIEVDCDRRVLRGSVQPRDYGLLLLTVGARRNASLPLSVALAERRPLLERRIRAMTTSRPRNPLLISLALVAVAVAATTAASKAPRPAPFTVQRAPERAPQPLETTMSNASITTAKPIEVRIASVLRKRGPTPLLTLKQIVEILAAHHPTVIIGDSSINMVTVVVDAQGGYVYSRASKTSEKESYSPLSRSMTLTERLTAPGEEAIVATAAVRDSVAVGAAGRGRAGGSERVTVAMRDTLGVSEMNVQRDRQLVEIAASEARTVTLLRGDSTFVRTSSETGIGNLVDPGSVGAVEVRKFAAGTLVPGSLGVIIIALKAPSGN